VGPDFPVAFGVSQWKGSGFDPGIAETPAELAAFLAPLAYPSSTSRLADTGFLPSTIPNEP
jgi:hypothetical protein